MFYVFLCCFCSDLNEKAEFLQLPAVVRCRRKREIWVRSTALWEISIWGCVKGKFAANNVKLHLSRPATAMTILQIPNFLKEVKSEYVMFDFID